MVRVENAADYPHFIDTVAQWQWAAWGHCDPDGSLEAWTTGLRSRANRDRVPMTFLAINDVALPIGSVTLVGHDMPDRTDLAHLSPWIAGTFVLSSERGKGVGSTLMCHAAAEASRLGLRSLYLYTSTARRFYERLGWSFLRDDWYEGEPIAIMALRLA